MKKHAEVNKSEAVRQLLAANPELTAPQIVEMLSKRGVSISDGLVYNVKSKFRTPAPLPVPSNGVMAEDPLTPPAPTPAGNVTATVLQVKRLASEMGGLRELKALVEALE